MPKGKFFTISYGMIAVLVIIFLFSKVQFIFTPLVIAFETLFFPFLLAGVLYSLFSPLIEFLTNRKVPRVLAILLLFIALISILVGISLMIGPVLQSQLNRLVQNTPEFAEALRLQWEIFQANKANFPEYMNEAMQQVTEKAQDIVGLIGHNLANFFSSITGYITNFIILLITVPFILFYMLKEGKSAPVTLLDRLSEKNSTEAKAILSDMNKALSTYVQGQVIVSLCVGIMIYVGYLIIGIDYSLVLALVAMFTNVIPFVGPFIGLVPALIVGFMESPAMMFKVMAVVLIAQQIESNFISPQIMGRALDVHPLTIILLLLVASSLAGIIGLILAVPLYAMLKVIVKHSYRLYKLRKA